MNVPPNEILEISTLLNFGPVEDGKPQCFHCSVSVSLHASRFQQSHNNFEISIVIKKDCLAVQKFKGLYRQRTYDSQHYEISKCCLRAAHTL